MKWLEALKKMLADKEKLISLTEDENEIKALSSERDDIIKQIGAEEARIELEKKTQDAEAEKAEAEKTKDAYKAFRKDKLDGKAEGQVDVKVVSAGEYKGFNLKKELAICTEQKSVGGKMLFADRPGVIKRMQEHPERAEKVLKLFIDLFNYANDPSRVGRAKNIKAAMQEGTDSEGGYLVPTEERSELLYYTREASVAMRRCTVINMRSDSMTIPAELAKVSVAFTAEESSATESEPTFSQVTLTAKRMDAYGKTSNELIEDAFVDGGIAGLLLDQFVEAVGLKIDSTVFKGSGDPVSGMFTAKAGYSEVFSSGSTAFSELLESNIRGLLAQIPYQYYETNGVWVTHYATLWNYIRGLKDSNGNYLFYDSRSGEKDAKRLWGYPVEISSQAPGTSGADTALAVFGDLTAYMIGERLSNIDLLWDPYTLMANYQSRYFMFTRWGFAPALPNKIGRIVTAGS